MEYDLVLYGATGFTGELVAEYLSAHPERTSFSWALAGRNEEKLRALESSLRTERRPGIIVADTADSSSVEAMVSKARAVITTVGPYSEYGGRTVVEACTKLGRHYADLSGEFWFQRQMIDEFHAEAERTGAKIIHAAGVDSVPSDLGAQLAMETLREKGARPAHVKALYTEYSGSMSGGTYRTSQAIRKLRRSKEVDRDSLKDPYVLAPGAEGRDPNETVRGWNETRFDRDFNTVGYRFFMAPINARNVRRSFALTGALPCRYEEGISVGAWLRMAWLWSSRGFGYLVGDPIPLKPKPGEGPPKWLRRAGGFRALVHAASEDGRTGAMVEVGGRGDPGYLATSKIFAEVGLCLVRDELPSHGGVLTPASALGAALRRRLAKAEGGRFMRLAVRR